ncbi:transmembrane protein, putative (macronuclear) [Tetrahymena thermophila SB210]|uniref:Transmembrane protein, putative n=1 Tax=Tetrahymena thermophila (strain SB210) TaxID=312017 RepID=Q241U9_TETTS|nr:transmembrane protein, putative [Tetrahymena thermophila SB210]EAS02471.2 transmembrane protein, putative [Tetrahymena thermophila SB210]|eukprot:XP_001022716.2 transmembrane protein, putative [Tetrahymena thermophila SB210]
MYFLNNIEIIYLDAKNFVFSGNGDQILQITSIQSLLQFVTFSEISDNNSLIQLNPLEKARIDKSRFDNISLSGGSIINFLQGELIITNSNFTNVNSTAYPCALNVIEGDFIQIKNCQFINLSNNMQQKNSQNQLLHFQGGAIKLQNTNITKIQQSLFKNCISQGPAGAIYSFQSKQQAIFEIFMTQFIENQSILDSGGAIYFLQQCGINITQSYFSSNHALKSQGGAIYFESSSLIAFQNSNFSLNQADIGGSVYYSITNQEFFKEQILQKNQIYFEKNKATFYGQNIGSIPFWIGISKKPSADKLKIVQQYKVQNISSGNYLDQPLYLNFIDEEGNPFNFIESPSLNSLRKEFSLQLYFQNNSQIIIQQGVNAQLNQSIGLFQLNFQSIYKVSQNQKIYIISNQIQQDKQLYLALELQYRDCIKGETIQEKENFIQCNQCVQGRYSLKIPDMQKDINSIQCISCPDSAKFCQGSQIILKDGYWRENNSSDQIYQCILNSCSSDNPSSKNGCIEGFVGPLCNSCDSKASVWKYQYGLKGQNCYVCSEWIEQYLYFSIYFALYFLYIAYSHHSMIKSKIIMYKLIIFKKIDLFITSKSSSQGKDFSLWFKIFINYLQILSCAMSFNITVPNFLNVSLNLFGDPLQLTVTSFDCLFKMSDKYPVWLNRIVTQVVSMVAIYFLINLSLILISIKQHKDLKKSFAQIPNIAKMTFIFIYLFYQPSLSKMLIQGVFCTQIGSDYYLISDYSQQCYTHYHNLYTFTITIPLITIWCFLIPLKIFFNLKSFQKLDDHHNPKGQRIENLLAYGVLYDGYKNKFLYWEIFKIFHKFILMSIINLNINQQTQVSLILLTIIFYYYILQKAQPHKNIKQFQTEKRLIFKLLYTFALLQLIISDNSKLSIYKMIGLIFIIYINITTIKLAIFIFVGYIYIQIDEADSCSNKFKKFLFQIKNKYPKLLNFLNFRRTKIIRIHQLWKKVIISFRQNIFTSKNFQSNKNYTLHQQSENSRIHHPITQKNQKSVSYLNSSNKLFSSNTLGENIRQNQLIPESLKLIQMSNFHVIPSQDSPNNIQIYNEGNKNASKSLFKAFSTPQNDQRFFGRKFWLGSAYPESYFWYIFRFKYQKYVVQKLILLDLYFSNLKLLIELNYIKLLITLQNFIIIFTFVKYDLKNLFLFII